MFCGVSDVNLQATRWPFWAMACGHTSGLPPRAALVMIAAKHILLPPLLPDDTGSTVVETTI